MVNIYLANGFEEVEALTVADMLRRAEIEVFLVSTESDIFVTGNHNICVKCDKMLQETKDCDMIVLPGGLPGVPNLIANKQVMSILEKHTKSGKKVAAICAAPWILGELGITKDIEAVCYPGFEEKLIGATISHKKAVTDKNVTTSKACGTAMDFSFEIIKVLKGTAAAEKVKNSIYFE
ncbi:MAG: DJ-1/PfpI family protein [Clostridia bacterium]|nr:DJ-1/PfpI family protein [Clostridia bacterium]